MGKCLCALAYCVGGTSARNKLLWYTVNTRSGREKGGWHLLRAPIGSMPPTPDRRWGPDRSQCHRSLAQRDNLPFRHRRPAFDSRCASRICIVQDRY